MVATNDFTARTRSPFTTLAADVAAGVRDLANAHSLQLQAEVREQTGRATGAWIILAAGAVLLILGIAFLGVAAAIALIELAGLPAAAAWGIVAVVVLLAGATAIFFGQQRLKAVTVVPKHTIQSVQESLQCVLKR